MVTSILTRSLWAFTSNVALTVAVVASASTATAAATTAASSAEASTASSTSESTTASTSKATASVASTATSTAFSSIIGVSIVDLDLLTIDDGSVQFLDGHGSTVVVSHCHEGITLFGDVHISDISASGAH